MATKSGALLDVHDVAIATGQDEQTVREQLRRGEISGFKAGRGGVTSPWRVRQAAVDAFIAKREAAVSRRRAA